MHNAGNHHQPSLNSPVSFIADRKVSHPFPGPCQNGDSPFVVASHGNYLLVKRVFDIVFSLLVITSLAWLFPLIALLVRLDSKGPVFFIQKRVGRKGKVFHCLKFRSMYHHPEAEEVPAEQDDPRITRVGKFLRRSNLDELPQFFNVLLGQMSVIGPRPHMAADCIRFSFVIPSYRFRHIVKPGITGWAQARGFHGPAPDYESIVNRFYWDAEYVRRAGLLLDTRIMVMTAVRMGRNMVEIIMQGLPLRRNGFPARSQR